MTYSLFFSTLYLAAGLLIFLMGFVILRENARSAVNRATSLMLFSGALGSILGALGRLLEAQEVSGSTLAYAGTLRNFAYLWEFFFPSLLCFALVYPTPRLAARRQRLVEATLYVPHLFHLALVLFFGRAIAFARSSDAFLARLGPGPLGDSLGTLVDLLGVLLTLLNKVHQQLFSLVNLAYAILAILLLHRGRRRQANARVRDQMSIVLLGLTVCVTCYTAAKLLPVFFPYRPSGDLEAALISVALIVASSAIAWAIVRYRFLDMQNLARRSILYGGTAVVFAIVYLVVVKQVTRFSAAVFGPNVEVIEAGFIVVSVIVFQPLLTALEDGVEALLRRRDAGDPRALIQDLSRRLAAEVDVQGMRARVAAGLQRGLLVEEVGVLIVEESPQGPVLEAGDRRAALPPGAPLRRLLGFFESAPEPVLKRDLERSLRSFGQAEREAIRPWIGGFDLLVPLLQQDRVRGILGLGPKLTGGRFHSEDMALVVFLAHQIGSWLENLRLLSENVQKRIFEEEIKLASEIQKGLLPTSFPERPGYRTHAVSFASKWVGGDYFDIFCVDGQRLHLAIADVSGKGVPAALLMAYLRAALRSNVVHLQSPGEVLSRLNNLLYESTAPEKFATFFYGALDTETHELVYANAGHNYPILLRSDGTWSELTHGGLVLGVLPDVGYADGQLALQAGDTLFLYTDGITEACSAGAGEQEFGAERLVEALCSRGGCEPRLLVEAVLAEVRRFTSGADPADDQTMVVVRRLPAQPAEEVELDVGAAGA